MRFARVVAAGAAALVAAGCTEGPGPLDPAAPAALVSAAATTSAARQVDASGTFDAIVDFSTLTLTPRGRNCLLTVKGQLVFAGTIEGPAVGQTTALVFATCDQVATSPPGTYPDVFHSELEFTGTIDGTPATASVRYVGRSEPGGRIGAKLIFSNGASGALDVEAQLAVGGSYEGAVVVK